MIHSFIKSTVSAISQSIIALSKVDVAGGLEKAKTEAISQIQPIINNIVIPIIGVVLVIILVFLIAGAAAKKKQGQEWSDKMTPIGIVLVILIVVGTAPLWMWSMAGIS